MKENDSSTEYEMLCRLRLGDNKAFIWLYDHYHILLYNYIFRFTKSGPVAEDILQDVFIKVWEARERIDPTRGAKAYFYRIARNTVYTHLTNMARQKELEVELMTISENLNQPAPLTESEHEQFEKILYAAVNELPERRKKVFKSCRMEGKSYDEVANQLGISKNTVKEHLVLALKFVKKRVGSSFKRNASLLILSLLTKF